MSQNKNSSQSNAGSPASDAVVAEQSKKTAGAASGQSGNRSGRPRGSSGAVKSAGGKASGGSDNRQAGNAPSKNSPSDAARAAGQAAKNAGQAANMTGQTVKNAGQATNTTGQAASRGRTRRSSKPSSAPAAKNAPENSPAAGQQPGRRQPAANPVQEDTRKNAQSDAEKASRRSRSKKPQSTAEAAAPAREPDQRAGGKQARSTLKIISLGGLGEIGKNLTVFECYNDIIIMDCGMAFPDDDLLGVDMVIPDFTYLERNADKIRGVFITHGHEDHIGGIPYLLKLLNIPLYGTPLTLGLVEGKLKEHGLLNKAKLNVVHPGDVIKAGCMSVEFIHVTHSIPDACALAITTPVGVVVASGDFKVDLTPISSAPIDLVRFGELGSKGVLALLCDSTNAEKSGSTPSESLVGESFDKLFKSAGKRRIIIATFASNVHRVQQIVDAAIKFDRKVAVFGRSMVNVVAKAIELGYLKIPEGVMVDVELLRRYPDDKIVLITTGSQGEPMSALTRMSNGDHRKVHIGPNDYIIISASPIPGNEKLVGKVVNELMKQGAQVIYERMYDVHVSGHACQDEIKLLISLTRPKFFIPVHGEYKHLIKNSGVAASLGYDSKHIVISDIGKVIETDGRIMKITGMVPSGRVLVDGLGVGDVGSVVLRDRRLLSEEGLIIAVVAIDSSTGELLAGPDLISRGFVYVRENEEMMNGAVEVVRDSINRCLSQNFRDWGTIKGKMRDDLGEYIFTRTRRKPMILPVVEEI